MISAKLEQLHREQLHAVSNLGLQYRTPRPKGLSDIISLASEAMCGVCPSFRYHCSKPEIGSWIASHSLPLQLLTQSRLTVDVTPDELQKERPFGIPFRSLCDLTREGFLYLNLRDYDSDAENGFRRHSEEKVAQKLEKLLKEVPGRIYIGSALRKSVFDAALKYSGYERSYEQFYKEAKDALFEAHRCYENLSEKSKIVKSSLFRGQRPGLVAVSWHWAFLNSVSHFLPGEIIHIGDAQSRLCGLYQKAADYGTNAKKSPKNRNLAMVAAKAFAELATQLRICHLNFTAPITASYGTMYNMTEAEYKESARLQLYWEPQAPTLPDQDIQRFIAYILSEPNDSESPSFHRLDALPNNVSIKQVVDDHIFSEGVVDILIGALIENRERLAEASAILAHIKDAYLNDERSSSDRLVKMISDYRKIKAKNVELYQKRLEQIWEYVIITAIGAAGFFTDPVSPWVIPIVSNSIKAKIPEFVQKLMLPPASHRAIYRVHRSLVART